MNFTIVRIEGKPSLFAKVALINGGNTEAVVANISFGASFGVGLAGRTPVPLTLPKFGKIAYTGTVSRPSLPLVLKPGDMTIVQVILSADSDNQIRDLGLKGLNRQGKEIKRLGLVFDVIDNRGEMREGIYNGFELPLGFSWETIEINNRVIGVPPTMNVFETPAPFK